MGIDESTIVLHSVTIIIDIFSSKSYNEVFMQFFHLNKQSYVSDPKTKLHLQSLSVVLKVSLNIVDNTCQHV